jgi:intracellular multiplication protein IcmB
VLFRSPDGKVLPFQPGSSKQTTWISLAFARPGSGKSVLMNVTNFALCLSDKLKRLPRISIIDIGPSSSGLISLIKEALPQDQRHLAVYERLRNTKDYSINPFDTQRGARFPTPAHRSFLMNLVTLLVTDPAKQEPPEGMSGLVMDAIDEVYRQKMDKVNPKRYSRQIDQEIDEAIDKHRIEIDSKTSWWEIVDGLFKIGEVRLAGKAQRHAVPTLGDLPLAANSEKMRQKYEMKIVGTGEDLIKGFCRMISNSQDRYPLLAYPTAFDLGDARVIALDLDEVARGGGVSGDRQTQVMYMLARQMASGDFYLNEMDIQGFPAPEEVSLPPTVPVEAYKIYHKKRIQDIREDLKRVCYDEFHRTSSSKVVRDQVILDMREGRKWNVDIMLASQAVQDFDDTMVNFATAIYIMDPGNAENLAALDKKFGLSPAENHALANNVHGPGPAGVTFMARFETVQGSYSSLLTLTVGALEMWALNTTVESVAIRKRLYERVGPKKARLILARAFPQGSAKSYVEERKSKVKTEGMLDEKAEENIYDSISEELIKLYGREFV